jgi:hypothetical protein
VIGETRATGRAGQRSECEYRRWRARQIAYGRWEPWTQADPVRQHVQALRRTGASYRAIGRAADVSPMTVHRLVQGEARHRGLPARIHAREAARLLAVTGTAVGRAAPRRDAAGTRLRLRALVAVGHPAVSLAAEADLTPRAVWDLLRGTTMTVSPAVHAGIAALYDRMWDQLPEERTAAQRRAVSAARGRAARNGWPPPMGLDDERIDDPRYRPRAQWRLVAGARACPAQAVAGPGRRGSRRARGLEGPRASGLAGTR